MTYEDGSLTAAAFWMLNHYGDLRSFCSVPTYGS